MNDGDSGDLRARLGALDIKADNLVSASISSLNEINALGARLASLEAGGATRSDVADLRGRLAAIEIKADNLISACVHTANGVNAVDTRLQSVALEAQGLREDLRRLEAEVKYHAHRAERIDWLHERARLARHRGAPARAASPAPAPAPVDFTAQMAELRRRAPLNFDLWRARFEEGRREYEKRLPTSLSTFDHMEAWHFRAFLAIHGRGRLLDIGVGPLAKPSYLDDFSDDMIAGLDPLGPYETHPFAFAEGAAEFLPWPDGTFDTVVAATSIDHVYLLDTAFEEALRVLAPGGRFILWTGLFAETTPYDPYSGKIEAPDAYHLFHGGENWFPQMLARKFRLIERFDVNTIGYANCFLACAAREQGTF